MIVISMSILIVSVLGMFEVLNDDGPVTSLVIVVLDKTGGMSMPLLGFIGFVFIAAMFCLFLKVRDKRKSQESKGSPSY